MCIGKRANLSPNPEATITWVNNETLLGRGGAFSLHFQLAKDNATSQHKADPQLGISVMLFVCLFVFFQGSRLISKVSYNFQHCCQ